MERYDLRFGLLMMDVDEFKKVNDQHGHPVGDQVLRMVAGTLLRSSRPFDLYGRWGGEEFIGLVRNVDAGGLREIGERCRMLIEKSYLTVGGSALSVTVSVGGVLAGPRDTAEALLERADQLMYQCKQAGRNGLMINASET
jgi:diguanylate cyclase (GGDEF)-like protein